jgi:outer membrane biosynthesis protein TonB
LTDQARILLNTPPGTQREEGNVRRFLAAWTALSLVIVGCSATTPRVSPDASDPGGLPSVSIESPTSGTRLNVGQTLRVAVRGEDARGVSRLDLRVGDVLVASASTPNAGAQPSFSATLEWTPSTEGEVTISALAYRPTGTGSMPASIGVTVVSATSAVSPSPVFGLVGTPSPAPIGSPTDAPPSAEPGGAVAEPTRAPRPTAPPAPRRKPRVTSEATPKPTKAPKPRATAAPTPDPTKTPKPKPTPSPTPDPTKTPKPKPTPSPTPDPTTAPVTADLRIRVGTVPDPWPAGEDVRLRVTVRNAGNGPSPRFSLRGQLIGASDLALIKVPAGRIPAGGRERFVLVINAPAGEKESLKVEARLLDGVKDATPDNNFFYKDVKVE